MNGVCSKCSGEGHVMVQGEDVHWHWEACPDCNGFEEMALAANVTFDSWGDRSGSEGRRMSEPRRNCRSCYYRNTTWIGSVEASASCDHPDFLPEGRGLTLTEVQAPEWCPLGAPSSAEEDAGADERRKLNDDLNDDLPW